MSDDLVSRIELLEACNSLLDLISAYAQGFDDHDPDPLSSIWHEDAFLDLGEPFGAFTGPRLV